VVVASSDAGRNFLNLLQLRPDSAVQIVTACDNPPILGSRGLIVDSTSNTERRTHCYVERLSKILAEFRIWRYLHTHFGSIGFLGPDTSRKCVVNTTRESISTIVQGSRFGKSAWNQEAAAALVGQVFDSWEADA